MDTTHRSDQPDPRAGRPRQPQPVRDPRAPTLNLARPEGELFGFVEIELPWPLGPPDGRYVIRASALGPVTHVLVVVTLGAPERRRLRPGRPRRRPTPVASHPAPVITGRATVISTGTPLPDVARAEAWLRGAGPAELDAGLLVLERALRTFRAVAADATAPGVDRRRLLVARVGYGTGDELAAGRGARARELAVGPARRGRRAPLAPQPRFAAVLGGRARLLVCEELVLRARADLDAGHARAAALQTLIALDAAIAELGAEPVADALADRVAELRELRPGVVASAQRALAGEPPTGGDAALSVRAVERLEAAARAHAADDAKQ